MDASGVLWAEANRFAVGWRIPAHAHADAHELIVVTGGALRTVIDGVARIAEPGAVVLHAAGRAHAEEAVGGRQLTTWFASWAARRGDGLDALRWQRDDGDGRIAHALAWAADAFAAGTPAGRAAAGALVAAAMWQFARVVDDPDAELVRRVRAHALARLAQPLGLADLARAAGLSRFHFARRFRLATGRSPMTWLRELRCDAARHLLARSERTLDAIAAETGFADRSQLSRAMRRVTGRPPSGWRR